jgi:hypothetical protein
MSITESDFQWFINNFDPTLSKMTKDEKGFIKASEFKRVASSSRNLNAKQYKELMKLAVDRGYATDNDKSPTDCKYAIRFSSSPVPVRLFDKDLLMDKPFFDNLATATLLRENLCIGDFRADYESWIIHTFYWQCVHRALVIYENTGEFKTGFLPENIDKQRFDVIVNRLTCAYEILKYGWNDIQLAYSLKNDNYNDCFKYLLEDLCEIKWKCRHENLMDSHHTQRKRLDDIRQNRVNRKDGGRLLFGDTNQNKDPAGHSFTMKWLIEVAKQSEDPNVKSALSRLEKILKEQEKGVYRIVRGLSRKK